MFMVDPLQNEENLMLRKITKTDHFAKCIGNKVDDAV